MNEARALRVTELMRDYQDIQRKIVSYEATPSEAAYNEIGFVTLRQCHAEARALLHAAYPVELLHPPSNPGEAEKRQLQRSLNRRFHPFLPREQVLTGYSLTELSSTPAPAASKPKKSTSAPPPP